MNIIFTGTSSFALESLKALYERDNYRILCVITQPDKPVGRKKILTASKVKEYATSKNIPVFQPEKISCQKSIDYIKSEYSPDAFIVAAYGQKIPSELLYFTKIGAINVHGSVLPLLRGAAPIQHAIINGMRSTGVTTMMMNEGMDTGDILLTRETVIKENETYGELSERLADMGAGLLIETLEGLSLGIIKPKHQNDFFATKAMSIKKEDTYIDFSKSAFEVHNLIRGLCPKPFAICKYNDKIIKIISSKQSSKTDNNSDYGKVLSLSEKGIEIACGKGTLFIEKVHPEGGNQMSALDFARGKEKIEDTFFKNISKTTSTSPFYAK